MTISARGKLALTALLATFALLAPSAAAVVVHLPNGKFLSVAPKRGIAAASIPGSVAAQHAAAPLSSNGNLNYHNGPVVRSSTPYLIFWTPAGETVSSTTRSLLARYFGDVAADSGGSSNVYGVDRQFTDGAGFADYKQTFGSGQAIVDTQPYPARDAVNCPDVSTSYPTCITDAQLQSELARLIGVDGLPTDGSSSAAELDQNAPIYFVVTPANVDVCADSADCADNVFCAYHSFFSDSGTSVLYASMPTLLAASDPKGCQVDGNAAVQAPNGDQIGDVTIKAMSHEDSETITDPLGTGWWNSSSGNEDGDECNIAGSFSPSSGTNPNAFTPTLGGSAAAGTLYNQTIDADSYYIQSEWSNGDVNCELRPSAGTISASFSVSSNPVAGSPVTFDPTASSSSNGYSSVSWNFGDGVTNFDPSRAGPTVVHHTYGAPGTYTVTLTLVDPEGNISRRSQPAAVGAPTCSANPTVTTNPSNETVTAPSGASFTAAASNPANCNALRVQWQVSSDGGATWSNDATDGGNTTGTLTINPTSTSQSGNEYRATFSNEHGSTNSTRATLTVNAPPPTATTPPPTATTPPTTGTPPPTTGTALPTAASALLPVISNLRISPPGVSISGRQVNGKCVKPTNKNNSSKHCMRMITLKISYILNGADNVTFTFKRKVPGRKVNGQCVGPTNKNTHKNNCTRLIRVNGEIVQTGKAGANNFSWNGKVGGHELGPGAYQLTATPAGGNPQAVTFTIMA